MSYGYRGPSIDHSLLSPSGRMSKRARAAAMKREHDRLFPPGYFDEPEPTPEQLRDKKIASLERDIAMWEDMAAHGVQPRKLRKAADKARQEIAALRESLA